MDATSDQKYAILANNIKILYNGLFGYHGPHDIPNFIKSKYNSHVFDIMKETINLIDKWEEKEHSVTNKKFDSFEVMKETMKALEKIN